MNRRIILGMGAGQCGLSLLPQILNTQPGTRITHEERPWLPWEKRPGAPGIRERLRRILATTTEQYVGDVASFYLPYIKEAISSAPDIRIICLARPREDVVAGFRHSLDQPSGTRFNHWAKEPAPGWSHDPFRTGTYPQYDTSDITEGIRRYWDEYYAAAKELEQRYPDHLRIWDTEELTTEAGVREMLTFAGFPLGEQVLVTGVRVPAPRSRVSHQAEGMAASQRDASGSNHPPPLPPPYEGGESLQAGNDAVGQSHPTPDVEPQLPPSAFLLPPRSAASVAPDYEGGERLVTNDAVGQVHPTPPGPPLRRGGESVAESTMSGSHSLDPKKCVILVPFSGFIHQDCDNALKELERRGYPVRRVGGYAAIDQARNQIASDALRDGFEETLWIDSDIGFDPDSVERIRSHGLPLVCGVYPKKGQRAIACNVLPGTPRMLFGEQGGLVELLYAGAGFLLVRREVYLKIRRQLQLPTCNERFGEPLIPFFYPLLHPVDDGYWYLAEDYAFCERARSCGYRIFADTTIRLWHIGTYRYGWEDAGLEPPRYRTFTLNFGQQPAAAEGNVAEHEARMKGFADQFPWPAEKPMVPAPPDRNWLFPSARDVLAQSLTAETRLVVELGSWTGQSTRYIADLAPQARVVAIDHWEGSAEHAQDAELAEFLPRLYETFLAECWEYRQRIIPLRSPSVDGLRRVNEAGLRPDLVYIDADHRYESVVADLTLTLELFPEAAVAGDDWDWESVRSAVETVARERGLDVRAHGTAWRIGKRPVP